MEPGLVGVVVGASIAGLVSLVLAVVNLVGQARRDSTRQLHERQMADGQREHELAIAHEDRELARMEKRYDDLKSAYVRFATEMRRIVTAAERSELDHQLRDDEYTPEPDPWDTQPEAEQALAELRLFADKGLYDAGRAWLDQYYKRFWWPGAKAQNGADVDGAENRFIAEAKRALGLAG